MNLGVALISVFTTYSSKRLIGFIPNKIAKKGIKSLKGSKLKLESQEIITFQSCCAIPTEDIYI